MPNLYDAVQTSQDLASATLQSFKKDGVQFTLSRPDFELTNNLFKNAETYEGGKFVEFDVVVGTTGNAKHVGTFENDTKNVTNLTQKGTVYMASATTNYSWDVTEIAINTPKKQIYDLLKMKRTNAFVELCELLEGRLLKPKDDSSDNDNPVGLTGWIAAGGGSGAEGFSCAQPYYLDNTNTYSAGNINASTYTRWKNYVADYGTAAAAIDSTILDYLGTAFRKTKFIAPLKAEQILDTNFNKMNLYSNNEVIKQLEKIARQSDDNVGADLGKYNGITTYKRLPIIYNSDLDTARTNVWGTNPIIGINYDYFHVKVASDMNFSESKPTQDKDKHRVLSVFIDVLYVVYCDNRQRGGFIVTQI